MSEITTNGLHSLLGRKSSEAKKRTTLYVGKDCKPELAEAICTLIGYKRTSEDILQESGTAIFTAVLLLLEEKLQK